MPKPDGTPTMHEAVNARNQAATMVREAQERQASTKHIRARERERAGKISAIPPLCPVALASWALG